MTMSHIEVANNDPQVIVEYAPCLNPDEWAIHARRHAREGRIHAAGISAITSIAARGHWLMINGQWRRNGL